MIIGLTGKAWSGKDTAALALRDLGFVRVAFADPMREMLRALGLRDEHMTGPAKELPVPHLGLSYRRLAQTLGTEWGRSLDPDLWVKVAQQRIRGAGTRVVITDVRFDNEARLIRSMRGYVLRIERDVPDVAAHASESGVADALIDYTIPNYGDKEDFETRVRSLARLWTEQTCAHTYC